MNGARRVRAARRLALPLVLAGAALLASCSGANNAAGNGAAQHPPRADFATPPGRPNPPPPPSLGARLPDLGDLIVASPVASASYNSDPPTSGPHLATSPRRGVYSSALPSEALPAFIARGGVEVLYNSSASPEVVRALLEIVNVELDRDPGLVLLAPRPQMSCQVAVTAWTQMIAFGPPNCQPGSQGRHFSPGSADEALVRQFIERSMCVYDPQHVCKAATSATPAS